MRRWCSSSNTNVTFLDPQVIVSSPAFPNSWRLGPRWRVGTPASGRWRKWLSTRPAFTRQRQGLTVAGLMARLRAAVGKGGGKSEADVSYDPVQDEDAPGRGRSAENAAPEYPGFTGSYSEGDSDRPGPAGAP